MNINRSIKWEFAQRASFKTKYNHTLVLGSLKEGKQGIGENHQQKHLTSHAESRIWTRGTSGGGGWVLSSLSHPYPLIYAWKSKGNSPCCISLSSSMIPWYLHTVSSLQNTLLWYPRVYLCWKHELWFNNPHKRKKPKLILSIEEKNSRFSPLDNYHFKNFKSTKVNWPLSWRFER